MKMHKTYVISSIDINKNKITFDTVRKKRSQLQKFIYICKFKIFHYDQWIFMQIHSFEKIINEIELQWKIVVHTKYILWEALYFWYFIYRVSCKGEKKCYFFFRTCFFLPPTLFYHRVRGHPVYFLISYLRIIYNFVSSTFLQINHRFFYY